jgi:signal transduction histidine kinase/DNA-binding NarL/FixJ family response regulator
MPESQPAPALASGRGTPAIRSRLSWMWTVGPVIIVLALGSVLSSYTFQAWREYETENARRDFRAAAGVRLADVRRIIMRSFDGMTNLQEETEMDAVPERVAFQNLAAKLLGQDLEFHDVVWAPVEPDPTRLTVHLAVSSGDASLLGRDIVTDPGYSPCLAKGSTPPTTDYLCLLPSGEDSFDFLAILPVTPRASAWHIAGFIAGRKRLDHLVDAYDPISLEIVDLAAPGVGLLHPHRPVPLTGDAISQAGGVTLEQRLGSHTWRFVALPVEPDGGPDSWQSLLVLTGCLAMTVIVAGYVRVDGLVRARTQELEAALSDLWESEQRLLDYVNTASDWYWETDANFRFTRVAAQAEEHGVDPATLAGLDKLTDGDADETVAQRLAVLQRHEPFRDLHYDYPRERSLLTITLSGMPMFGDDGRFLGYRGSARDVTIQMQAEAAQRSALWAAEQANRAKSTFLATMSHEIRTPMNGVLGMAQVLRQTALDEEQRRMCDLIFQSGNSLQQILNDILDYSKLEAGKIEIEAVSAWLPAIVDDVVSLMRGAAETKGLSIEVQASGTDLAPVMTDPTRVRQILFNLLSNAIKFSERGVITVKLLAVPTGSGALDIALSVADQGIGISPEVQRRLFARFTQADPTTTRRFGGTGLGLAITRELVTLLGGEIAVASKPGQGTTFTIRLSLPVAEAVEAPSRQGARALYAADTGRSVRILLAEDDKLNQMVMLGLLRDHSVTIARNGEEAVRAASGDSFDIILMDIMMPVMDGLAATALIRALPPPFGAVPIIALTANAMSGDREQYLAAGMKDYVSKPVERERMFTVMEQVLGVALLRPRPVARAQAAAPAPAPAPAAVQNIEDFIGSLDG